MQKQSISELMRDLAKHLPPPKTVFMELLRRQKMEVKQAVVEELKRRGLKSYLGAYHDFTLDELKSLGFTISELYMGIADKVNPEWRQLISTDGKAFIELWTEIDNTVEGHGYYMAGEAHNTPLIKGPDTPVETLPTGTSHQPSPAVPSYVTFAQYEEALKQRDAYKAEVRQLEEKIEGLKGIILDGIDECVNAINVFKEGTK